MEDYLLRENNPPPTGYPDWQQDVLDRIKGDLTSAFDRAGSIGLELPPLPPMPGLYTSDATRQEFVRPDASPEQQAKQAGVLSSFDRDAFDQGQTVILVTPNDIQGDAPYDVRAINKQGYGLEPDKETLDKKPPGLRLAEEFDRVADQAGLGSLENDDIASGVRNITSRPGSGAAASIDAANIKAVRNMKPDDIANVPENTCIITLPNDKGVLPIVYPNNLGLADGIGQYSAYAPIYDQHHDGSPTGFDPKTDMGIWIGYHELDHCTNMEDPYNNPFPEYDSDIHAGRKYAEAYGQGLASDATVPYFTRSLRAENTILDQQGKSDNYILNGIAPLPGEGKPLSPSEQRVAAEQIKDFREDLYEKTGISEEMMSDPSQLGENRYALYHETDRMLQSGELNDSPYAKQLAENFTDGVKRYQPDNYGVGSENVIAAEPTLPNEAYGMSPAAPPPQLPNFSNQSFGR